VRRFHWSLQRLLDVTVQRERAARAEVMALSRQIAGARQEATIHRAEVSRALAEVSAMALSQRLHSHPEFIRYAESHERRVGQLEKQIAALAAQRAQKSRVLLATRRRRETLDRLRAEARQQHLRDELKAEQKQFDEAAHVSRARKMIAERIGR